MKTRMYTTKNTLSAGFTLVETLVAISILVISITGPMYIISHALKSSYYSRDQITAFYLAQEAVEYLRYQRDNNGLAGGSSAGWLTSVGQDGYNNANLINQYGSQAVKAELVRDASNTYQFKQCTQSGTQVCPKLRYDSNGILGSDNLGNTSSIYTREIVLSYPASDPTGAANRELVVYVKVSWNTGGIANSVSIREQINNWQLEQ